MARGKFTEAHIKALDQAIARKRANPGLEFITASAENFVVDAAPAAVGDNVGAVPGNNPPVCPDPWPNDAIPAVVAAVGAETAPADPSFLKGKIPKGGFSLEDLIKAREHAIRHSA